ncbi:uncharacterized protein [Linepithema humile]|uniref:uncharacterized protein isoform X1 n=2 Tax=Linepithema humile TaxID=83485 RepID=UPI00351DEB51
MNLRFMLLVMITMLKNSVASPFHQRKLTYNRVIYMFTIYLKLKRLESAKKQKRKCWVRPIFQLERRRLQGASDNLVLEMQLNDSDKYFNYFRMSPETFQRLLVLVGPGITKQECIREPIPPRTRLEVTLRYLASGDSMTSISYAFRIGHNTVSKIIAEVCEEIWTTLKEKVFLQLNETNWHTISDDFNKDWNFPHCIGAIDGKHIVMQAPANSGSCFYNYKGNHSINLLAISDAKYRFIIVDIGAPGRQGDSGVLTNSGLMNLLEDKKLKIPPAAQLDGSNEEFPFVFVADEAFPLTTYMMRPYSRSGNLNITNKIFNYRLSRARRVVESSFGILAARWRIFRRPIIACTSTVQKIVQASTALHNFIITSEEHLPLRERRYQTLSTADREIISMGLVDINKRNRYQNLEAIRVRNAYASYFEDVNPLSWQWDKVLANDF